MDTPPLTADRAVPTVVATDRAIDDSVGADRAVAGTSIQFRNQPREPLNRRGRRHLSAEIGRSQRRILRSIARQELAERAARTNARF